jgi:putative FmdB family regulatory protein
MPLFEYTCDQCKKRFTVLVGMTADSKDANACPHCGANQATKRISRFSRGRSDEDIMEDMMDREESGDRSDPAEMRRWAKDMGEEAGDDMGDDFEEYLDAADSGDEDY